MNIELIEAEGEFTPSKEFEKTNLSSLEYELNLVIDYDEDILRERRLEDLSIPRKKHNGRIFSAQESGGRSAVIYLEDGKYKNLRIHGIKIKGCRYLDMPPLPILYTEKRDGIQVAEMQTIFDDNGNKKRTYINQPIGFLVSNAKHEVSISNYVFSKRIPVNTIGLGYGEYDAVYYEIDDEKEQMGTFVAGLLSTDRRVEEIVLSRRDKGIYKIPLGDAKSIVSNLKRVAEKVDVGGKELVYEIIFKGVGQILNRMHTAEIIHGPRQSHLLNYTQPTKKQPIRICDLGNAQYIKGMTIKQAKKYMSYDLGLLIKSSINFFYSLNSALLTLLGDKTYIDSYVANPSLFSENPADYIIRGYTNNKMSLKDVPLDMGGLESGSYFVVSEFWGEEISTF